jgi:hypothetical protein
MRTDPEVGRSFFPATSSEVFECRKVSSNWFSFLGRLFGWTARRRDDLLYSPTKLDRQIAELD